jgi:hypothetical protein
MAVQANEPDTGRECPTPLPAIPTAIATPPDVAAYHGRPSLRRKQHSPEPAKIGCITTITLIARIGDRVVNSSIGGRYIHPDWTSAANGEPEKTSGFHIGTCPDLSE